MVRGTERKRHRLAAWLPALGFVALGSVASAGSVNLSGSAYVDYLGVSGKTAREASLSGVTPEIALKVEVDAHEDLSFSGKVCFGCHGLEIDRAQLEYTPKSWLNVQAGRVVVPFGEFAMRYDPSSHPTASKPLPYEMGRMLHHGPTAMNLGVVPTPYVDTGAVVFGQVWWGEQVQIWYGGYAVAGFRGDNDFDFVSSRSLYYVDNNRAPAGGGRLAVTYSAASPGALLKDLSFGASGMYGRYDPALRFSYTAVGLDGSARVGPVTVRAEGALRRTDINPDARGYRYAMVDAFIEKSGFYAEVEHPLGRHLQIVYRLDGLRRAGQPLPGSVAELSPDSQILRYTQGAQLLLGDAVFAKVSYERWWMSDFPEVNVLHAGVGGTF
ncbi:MAG: hypothetical protein HYZ28_05575 [Myxococcales bacterium]|nr:hypothetical protein [Myxococcales bacterium]